MTEKIEPVRSIPKELNVKSENRNRPRKDFKREVSKQLKKVKGDKNGKN